MRHNAVKLLAATFVAGVTTLAFSTGIKAYSLDTQIPCAGISVALSNYIETVDNSETQIVALLPEKVEKATPARNPIFNNMAIAFVDNYVNVRKKPTTESKIVGKIYSNCSATIIEETSDGWYKIESGNVTGYIKAEYFLTGLDAEEYAIENGYVFAQIKEAGLRVREKASLEGDIITNVYENEIYVIKKYKQSGKWAKLAIGEGVSGWVSADYIEMSVNMDTAITLKEEKAMLEAEAERQRQEEESKRQAWLAEQAAQQYSSPSSSSNDSDYSSGNSVSSSNNTDKPATSYNSGKASDVVAYAKQFLGNPYVYGGSSLTNGTDCSGFTMSVYKHFGYNINRSSYTQVYNGTAVSLSDVQPGDLVFYKNGGSKIGHVAMYIGGGQIIHASTPQTGIIISSMYSNTPCAARRIIN